MAVACVVLWPYLSLRVHQCCRSASTACANREWEKLGLSFARKLEGGHHGTRSISRRESLLTGTTALTVACGLNFLFAPPIGATESKSEDISRPETWLEDTQVMLYSYPLAFNPAKAKLALEEKSIKYTEKVVDLFDGQSLEPWYLKINPKALTPTLVAGKTVILESAEIIKWADARNGSPLGADKVDRTFIDKWISKVDAWDGNLFAVGFGNIGGLVKLTTDHKIKVAEVNAKKYPDLAELYSSKVASMKEFQDQLAQKNVILANKAQLVALLDEAEECLGKNKYLAGEEYSIADVIFSPVVYRIFTVNMERELLDPRTNLKKYWSILKTRPSYKATFGVADSVLATAGTVLPALGKIFVSKLTGKY